MLKSNKATVAVRFAAHAESSDPAQDFCPLLRFTDVTDCAGNAIHKEILRSLKYAIVWVRWRA